MRTGRRMQSSQIFLQNFDSPIFKISRRMKPTSNFPPMKKELQKKCCVQLADRWRAARSACNLIFTDRVRLGPRVKLRVFVSLTGCI